MEQKVIEVSQYWLRSTIDREYEKGWLVIAITIMEDQKKYLIVLQRPAMTNDAKVISHQTKRAMYTAPQPPKSRGYMAYP